MKNFKYVYRIIEDTQIKSLSLDPYPTSSYKAMLLCNTALEFQFRHS